MDDAIRLRRPDREQMLLTPCDLDGLVPKDHDARTIWAAVERLDLSAFYSAIAARGSDPGRPATDPQLLVALWLYATKEGIGSGRELAERCVHHDAYRWLCGGVPVNYHTLNDFRVGHEKALDDLFTQVLANLVHHDVVQVNRVAQDGTRVRAHAGQSSFRRRRSLEQHRVEMAAHIQAVKRQAEDGGAAAAARLRAAVAKRERLDRALSALDEMEAAKARQKNKPSKHREARASTTDPDARVMKMPGGGFAPAYNVQLATDVDSRAIVGVSVTNAGSDAHESEPMRSQVVRRTGREVRAHLFDGGFVHLASIERAERSGVKVYAPVPEPKGSVSRYRPRAGDGPGVAAWRRRMRSPAARRLYARRAATSETVNADLKAHRGLRQFPVRGLSKVRCVSLWASLAYNVMHFAQYLLE